jgi:type I restriction enzyme S subunit
LVIPPIKILEKFNNLVKHMIEKINKNLQENNSLEKIRDFLLPLLMNGQVDFKNF